MNVPNPVTRRTDHQRLFSGMSQRAPAKRWGNGHAQLARWGSGAAGGRQWRGTSAAGAETYSAKTVVTTTGTEVHCTKPLIPPASSWRHPHKYATKLSLHSGAERHPPAG